MPKKYCLYLIFILATIRINITYNILSELKKRLHLTKHKAHYLVILMLALLENYE